MSETVERNYTMEDLQMLQMSQVFQNAFVIDLAEFTADFPNMDASFGSEMQTAIDDADAFPSGDEIESEIAVVTEELNAQLPLGRKALQKLYTYVELAWGSKAKDNAFGRSKYLVGHRSQMGMKNLLDLGYRQAQIASNKAELLAIGYTQVAIDELKTIAEAIEMLSERQEDMYSESMVVTEHRVEAYNRVWEFMKRINRASKVTYVDSPAKLKQYMLYPNSGGKVKILHDEAEDIGEEERDSHASLGMTLEGADTSTSLSDLVGEEENLSLRGTK